MAKKKELLVDDTFRAMLGLDREPEEENEEPVTESPAEEKPKPEAAPRTEKRGRPKLQREKKKSISYTILPSLHEKALELAYREGKSLSQLIEDLLSDYIERNS